ncbi:MAG TPA: DUF1501 domain-containing protein [Planctomycetota bacterium]|nr:DUF1501 domain-containing protein [Planctomycetota bacterium]
MTLHDLIAGTDATTRRAFASNCAFTCLGVGLSPLLLRLGAAAGVQGQQGQGKTVEEPIKLGPASARNVIYLFLRGGMSQLDTFDPKPGQKTQGPVEALRTNADDVLVSQHFPNLANHMDKVCVVNSMTSTQGAHPQAQYLTRTSFELRGTIQHPSIGAWVNRLAGKLNANLPGHVMLNGGSNIPSAGFFPPQYLALPLDDPKAGLQHSALPADVGEAEFQRRLQRLQQLDQAFEQRYRQREVKAYSEMYADAVRLMRSSDLAAFDIGLEPGLLRSAYGESNFGQGCLLARRLVEHGVRFVEVMSDGWDTHADNFDRMAENCPDIDRGLSALLADLEARGLLEQTLVVLTTEFGRTPDIDGDNGRNHYPKAYSSLLAGGGIRGGSSWGKTSSDGREVIENPVRIQDFNATIAHALGLPLDHVVTSPSGRPFKVADKGQPLLDLFA